MYMYVTESLYAVHLKHNIVNQLHFNKKKLLHFYKTAEIKKKWNAHYS